MSASEAAAFGLIVAGPVVGFVMLVAVFLLGLAVLAEITR